MYDHYCKNISIKPNTSWFRNTYFIQISETTISLERKINVIENAMNEYSIYKLNFLQNSIGCGHDNDKKTFISVAGILPSGKPIKFSVLNLNS